MSAPHRLRAASRTGRRHSLRDAAISTYPGVILRLDRRISSRPNATAQTRVGWRSSQSGLVFSTNAIFQARFQCFSRLSRRIASAAV